MLGPTIGRVSQGDTVIGRGRRPPWSKGEVKGNADPMTVLANLMGT